MTSRGRLYSFIIVTLFMAAILVPLAGAIWQEDRTLSYSEKRKLQQLPELPDRFDQLRDFVARFERYYNDQFGFREYFLEAYGEVKKVLGDHDISNSSQNVGTKNTIKGKNGWFFLNRKWDGDPVADYRNITLYSDTELLRSTLLFAARADWLKKRGVEYLLFFAPNKHTVYEEYLPDYITKTGDISSLDQLNDALQRYTRVHFVDLREALRESKQEAVKYWKGDAGEPALYYTTDSHWNGAGADIAQYEVARKLQEIFPGRIVPFKRPPEDFVMKRFAGDITLIQGRKDEDAYGPALESGLCTPETAQDYLQRSHVTICEKNSLNAVIFYDSFLPPLKPYFSDYFRRVSYHWERMKRRIVEREMDAAEVDIVLEQRAERHLPFTPEAIGEDYSEFWEKYWSRWKTTLFRLDLEEAASGAYRSANLKTRYAAGEDALHITALTFDPYMYLPDVRFAEDSLYMIRAEIISDHETELQIYYEAIGKREKYPSEPYSYRVALHKGENSVYIPLFTMDLAGRWRIDPGKKEGKYVLRSLEIKMVDWIDMRN